MLPPIVVFLLWKIGGTFGILEFMLIGWIYAYIWMWLHNFKITHGRKATRRERWEAFKEWAW